MSYQVLARKWRPKKFQDVIGQEHVTKSLQNAIATDKIGHAYMLVGTRGVGKTSVARIFAKAIRCESRTQDQNACGVCRACLDFDTETSMNVIEIDGASNNSVDNIRELISNVHYLPTTGKYKVYIIDEVHMLSANAFNALLKTLEEPPAHVVFIFATTEAHKLLGTVLSRCQRFDFKNVPTERLAEHVKEIAAAEGVRFENDTIITQLAQQGRGSVRDTLSLLDQVLTFSENSFITETTLTFSLGIASTKTISELKMAILNEKTEKVSSIYNGLLLENVSTKNILSSLLDDLSKEITINKNFSKAELIWIYETVAKETTWIFDSISPDKAVEVLLLKVALRRTFFSNVKIATNVSTQTETMSEERVEAKAIAKEIESAKGEEELAPIGNDIVNAFEELKNLAGQLDEMSNAPIVKVQEKKEEVVVREVEENKTLSAEEKTWEGFLKDLLKKSPATASNLEQGNILKPIEQNNDFLSIEIGFGFSGEVFIEYLQESEVHQKLVNNLASYFQIDASKVNLQFQKVNSATEFVSSADEREQEEKVKHEQLVQDFKSNPLLKEAEKIFNAKIDKVILSTNTDKE